MAKKDKVVELKTKADKISEEHLKRVQDSVNAVNGLQFNIGKIEVQKHELLHSIAGSRDELVVLKNEFKNEYGTFDINIQDGTINYE